MEELLVSQAKGELHDNDHDISSRTDKFFDPPVS